MENRLTARPAGEWAAPFRPAPIWHDPPVQECASPSGPPDAAILDRARGALLGLAVGDALGTTLEFSRRDEHPHHAEMTGGGPFRLAPGQWTDDTSMALALAESLIAHGDLDARDLMDRFLSWWRDGEYSCTGHCFDIGSATRGALARYAADGDIERGLAPDMAVQAVRAARPGTIETAAQEAHVRALTPAPA